MSVRVLRRTTYIVMGLSVIATVYSILNQRSEPVEEMIIAMAIILLLGGGILILTRSRNSLEQSN